MSDFFSLIFMSVYIHVTTNWIPFLKVELEQGSIFLNLQFFSISPLEFCNSLYFRFCCRIVFHDC